MIESAIAQSKELKELREWKAAVINRLALYGLLVDFDYSNRPEKAIHDLLYTVAEEAADSSMDHCNPEITDCDDYEGDCRACSSANLFAYLCTVFELSETVYYCDIED